MSFKDTLKPVLVPIHPEGYAFITIFAIATLAIGLLWEGGWFIGLPLTAWCIYFFRDPERVTPVHDDLVISPADGVVQSIIKAEPPEELEMPARSLWRVAIFMNVFDVHVNRTPVAGRVSKMHYRPGKFLNASLDKASRDNERQSYRIEMESGEDIAVIQIAGLVARRIVCETETGDYLRAGQRIGMIRFGSRVDVYLPTDIQPVVCVGQKMIAGETVLAHMSDRDKDGSLLKGEIR